ncbi:MAG: type II secretion system F family protein [Planctomycetaceae bacterium]
MTVSHWIWFVAVLWLVSVPVATWFARIAWVQQRSRERLHEFAEQTETHARHERNWLAMWLFRAGFRGRNAFAVFIGLTGVGVLLGGVVVWSVLASGLVGQLELVLYSLPGGVGEVFLPFAWSAPWLAGLTLGVIPAVVVRGVRLRRVTAIEQDLPITLDLLSTLAESGLSFDAALARILETQPAGRPLGDDLRLFQLDVLAGRRRSEALRRLMDRVDVPWFSIFISAVMHAEQVGSGLAQTLRVQAEDLRMRRRERALALAMGVPVKLLFPLIVCFLPGIMVAALGPVIYQIIQVLDQFLRGALGG